MTLRSTYDELFKTWKVEYLNTWTGNWNTCEDFYPKTGRSYASFKSEAEANEFMDWKYNKAAKEAEAMKNFTPCNIPSNYYGVRCCYYGD